MIRPQGYTVFGVDNFNGNVDDMIYEETIKPYITEDGYDFFKNYNNGGNYFQVGDKLYVNQGEKIIGLTVSATGCDSDFIRCLSVFYPEFESFIKFDIPVLNKDDHYLHTREYERKIKLLNRDVNWNWFYPSVVEVQTLWYVYAEYTKHLFNQIGVSVDIKTLKAMFIVDWK